MRVRAQRGVALVLMLLAMPVLVMVLQGQFGLAQATVTALDHQRAVDQAAFSMAAVTADTLNQIAINNQAIVASHLLQGHLVTQLSWTRYAVQLAHRGSWVMGWGAPSVAVHAHQAATRALQVQEQLMPVWTQRLNLTVQAYQAANRLAQMRLAEQLLTANQRAGTGLTVARFNPQVPFAFGAAELEGNLLDHALSSRDWLNQRSWSQSFFGLFRLNKSGHSQSEAGQWKAEEQLTFKVRRLFGSKTVTVAQGAANSRDSGYWGSGQVTTLKPFHLWMSAHAGAHHAFSEVFSDREGQVDQALLYPVWDARLVDPSSLRLSL